MAIEPTKLDLTWDNNSLTLAKASELANSPVVKANKALTKDPSTFLEILFYTFSRDFLALLTYKRLVSSDN